MKSTSTNVRSADIAKHAIAPARDHLSSTIAGMRSVEMRSR
jgi:hypothetical protein